MTTSPRRAGASDIGTLTPLVQSDHAAERIDAEVTTLDDVLMPLLQAARR